MADSADRAMGDAIAGERSGAPDRTATGKAHFEVLDGLRGTAALIVVLFHIQGITVKWDGARVVLHHAPLAVDFFFALSAVGFRGAILALGEGPFYLRATATLGAGQVKDILIQDLVQQ